MPQTASRRQAISRIVAIGAALAAAPVQHAAQAYECSPRNPAGCLDNVMASPTNWSRAGTPARAGFLAACRDQRTHTPASYCRAAAMGELGQSRGR